MDRYTRVMGELAGMTRPYVQTAEWDRVFEGNR